MSTPPLRVALSLEEDRTLQDMRVEKAQVSLSSFGSIVTT